MNAQHNVDSRTKQIVVDPHTGQFEVRGYEISPLGRLLLQQIGVETEDAD